MPPERDPALSQSVPEAMVRVDALRRVDELCAALGGDHTTLFGRVQLDPALLANRHAMFPLRTLAQLFERAAIDMDCPDFALRLAVLQDGEGLYGPLDIAMRHAPTLGAALRYGSANFRAYSAGIEVSVDVDEVEQAASLTFVGRLPSGPGRAAVEAHCLLSFRYLASRLSEGEVDPVRVQIIEFDHMDMNQIEQWFSCPVATGSTSTIAWRLSDLDRVISGTDSLLLEMATDFVETRYPGPAQVLSVRVRANIERFLAQGPCTQERVAETLAIHPRTLQRRLKEEGLSFDVLKEEVRRDLAWQMLAADDLALAAVAARLGYADASVLSRACLRWFGMSPRSLRQQGLHRSGG